MASLFAALLSAGGVQVKMLATWDESIKVLSELGVTFIDQDGNEKRYPVTVTSNPEECSSTQFAIVLVKSYQTEEAAKRLRECLAADGFALTLQNGLGNQEILAQYLGEERVMLGVTTMGATLMGPGVVRMGGKGGISIGEHDNVDPPVEVLRQAGFEVEVVPDTSSLVWGKLVINAAINPLTALLGVRNGALLENPDSHQLMNLIAIETAQVAEAMQISLPYSDPVEAVEAVARKTASNFSSMYIDLHRGTLTEVDAINGAVVDAGDNVGAPAEYNRLLWLLVKASSQFRNLS